MTKQSSPRKAVTHSTIYAIGNILRQLAGFIMLPVYTRYLTPQDYGVVGLILFSISLAEIFFGARLVHSVPKFYHESNDDAVKKSVISTALITTFAVSLVFSLVLIAGSQPLSVAIIGVEQYGSAFSLFAVLLLTQAVEYYGMTFLRIQQLPVVFVLISLLKLIVQLIFNVYFVVYKEMEVFGVALSSAMSSSFFAIGLVIYTLHKTGTKFDFHMAIRQLNFCWPLWIGSIAGIYIGSANRYYIRLFSTLDDIGLYELAVKFASILMLIVWEPFSQYWNIERFALYKQSNGDVSSFVIVFRFIVSLMAFVGVGIALFSGEVITIMASEFFHGAFYAVPPLIASAFFMCLAGFCDLPFYVKDKTAALSRIPYLVAAFVTGFYVLLIPEFGFVGAAYALMLAHIFQFLITYGFGQQYLSMKLDLRYLSYVFVLAAVVVTAGVYFSSSRSFLVRVVIEIALFVAFSGFLYFGLVSDEKSKLHFYGFLRPIAAKLK